MANIGDISLNGKKYRIDIDSFRARDVIDFAPRATVPGGSVVMSDLGLYQPLVQTDWQHGFGFHWHSDALGYLSTTGNVDTRQDGLVMLMTQPTQSDTDNYAKEGFVNWNSAVYAWGASGLRKYSGGSWSSIYSSGAVNFAMAAGDYLFFCPNGARIQKINVSDTVSNAGLDANSTDYKWLVVHNGYIYAGKDETNRVHISDEVDLSDLEGTSADTNCIYVGLGNKPTLGAVVYAGELYIARQDGLWHMGEDNIARLILNYSPESSDNNFRGFAEINGFLTFPIRDKMIQWNGARVAPFTPNRITDTFPFVTYGRFDNLVSAGNLLYMTGRTNSGTYSEDILCFDGVGWHKLARPVTNGSDTITAMGFDTVNNYLWYHVDSTADKTYYIQLQANSPFPYANFPTSGEHSLITSRYDVGFRRVQKSLSSLWVEAYNLSSTVYINVYYSIDGGTWTLWDTVNTNGITELTYPGGERTREFFYCQFKFEFITASSTASPILESMTMRFILRPNTSLGYSFNVLAAEEYYSDLRQDERTGSEIIKELRAARNSKSPILFVDLLKDKWYGYITAVTEHPAYRHTMDDEEAENIEYWAQVNFVTTE